jgi:hypothetical protein
MSFRTVGEDPIFHDPDDELEASGVSMKPDRTIGLRMKRKYEKYLAPFPDDPTHSLYKNVDILYPFLVVEAKRESNTPGFRAIEAQTAFPIRRFLKLQDNLRKTSKMNLDPLVWFFAFQGEEWRLYAATLDYNEDNKVVGSSK